MTSLFPRPPQDRLIADPFAFNMVASLFSLKKKKRAYTGLGASNGGCAAANAPSEILLLILGEFERFDLEPNVKERRLMQQTLASAPLVCKGWLAPGNEALYKRVYLSSKAASRMARALKAQPGLGKLVAHLSFFPCHISVVPTVLAHDWGQPALRRETFRHMPPGFPHEPSEAKTCNAIVQACPFLDELAIRSNDVWNGRLKVHQFPISPGILTSSSLRRLHLREVYGDQQNSSFIRLLNTLSRPEFQQLETLTLEMYTFTERHLHGMLAWQDTFPQVENLAIVSCDLSVEIFTVIIASVHSSLHTLLLHNGFSSTNQRHIDALREVPDLEVLTLLGKINPNINMRALTALKVLEFDAFPVLADFAHIRAYPPNLVSLRVSLYSQPSTFVDLQLPIFREICRPLPDLVRLDLQVYSTNDRVHQWQSVAMSLPNKVTPMTIGLEIHLGTWTMPDIYFRPPFADAII